MLKERTDRNVEERWRKVGNIKRGWVTDARREGECKPRRVWGIRASESTGPSNLCCSLLAISPSSFS